MFFEVGRGVEDTVDGGLTFGDVQQFLVWEAPATLHVIKAIPDAPGHWGQFEHKLLVQYGFIK
jgi:hypothetical protein